MKVVFTNPIPNPYRQRFYLEMSKYCDLTLFMNKAAILKEMIVGKL